MFSLLTFFLALNAASAMTVGSQTATDVQSKGMKSPKAPASDYFPDPGAQAMNPFAANDDQNTDGGVPDYLLKTKNKKKSKEGVTTDDIFDQKPSKKPKYDNDDDDDDEYSYEEYLKWKKRRKQMKKYGKGKFGKKGRGGMIFFPISVTVSNDSNTSNDTAANMTLSVSILGNSTVPLPALGQNGTNASVIAPASNTTTANTTATNVTAVTAAPAAAGLKNGESVVCTKNDIGHGVNSAIYRFVGNNTLSWYPSPPILLSWEPTFKAATKIDCVGFTKGPDMGKNP